MSTMKLSRVKLVELTSAQIVDPSRTVAVESGMFRLLVFSSTV